MVRLRGSEEARSPRSQPRVHTSAPAPTIATDTNVNARQQGDQADPPGRPARLEQPGHLGGGDHDDRQRPQPGRGRRPVEERLVHRAGEQGERHDPGHDAERPAGRGQRAGVQELAAGRPELQPGEGHHGHERAADHRDRAAGEPRAVDPGDVDRVQRGAGPGVAERVRQGLDEREPDRRQHQHRQRHEHRVLAGDARLAPRRRAADARGRPGRPPRPPAPPRSWSASIVSPRSVGIVHPPIEDRELQGRDHERHGEEARPSRRRRCRCCRAG